MTSNAEVTDWHEYFVNIRLAREEAEREAEEHDDTLEVTEPSRPARPEDLSASLKGIIASLTLCGFWSASQVTVAFVPGKVFKGGPRAGESRPDKVLLNVFTHAAHPDHRIVSTWYQDGSLMSAKLGVAHGNTHVVASMKELESFIEGRTE